MRSVRSLKQNENVYRVITIVARNNPREWPGAKQSGKVDKAERIRVRRFGANQADKCRRRAFLRHPPTTQPHKLPIAAARRRPHRITKGTKLQWEKSNTPTIQQPTTQQTTSTHCSRCCITELLYRPAISKYVFDSNERASNQWAADQRCSLFAQIFRIATWSMFVTIVCFSCPQQRRSEWRKKKTEISDRIV